MGIKTFSQAFTSIGKVTVKDFANCKIAIDAATEIWSSMLGIKNPEQLTDKDGNPTIHIQVILTKILNFHKNKINMVWVFDYIGDDTVRNPNKTEEVKKRRANREKALADIKTIEDVKDTEPMFSDDEEDEVSNLKNKKPCDENKEEQSNDKETEKKETDETKINALKKRAFRVTSQMYNDVIKLLTMLGISYVNTPSIYEGECAASYLNKIGEVDAVYSSDTDPIAYGAPVLYRYVAKTKTIQHYTQQDIIAQISEKTGKDATIDSIRHIAVALGTDFNKTKTPGIGAKTVIKKFADINYTDEQLNAIKEYEKKPVDLVRHNFDKTMSQEQIKETIEWLVNEKQFNRARITKLFEKLNEKPKKSKKKKVKDEPARCDLIED